MRNKRPLSPREWGEGQGEGRVVRAAAALAAAMLLAGCMVGPNYVRPETAKAAELTQAKADTYSAEAPVAEFWRGFNDAQLTQLVEGALAANTDLRAGVARLQQARALARQSRFDLFPTVTAEGGYTESKSSAEQGLGAAARQELYDAGATAFWELDFFGRVRRGVEASRAEADATAADLRALQVSVAGEVARSYFELRGQQEQLRVARRNAENQRETLALTEARLKAGRGTELDTARATSQLQFTLSRIPVLEAGIATAAHRIAVLNAREPGALLADLLTAAPLPALPQAVAVGSPAELLRRRPDIQAAERRLAAATARIGVATADLFPRFTLGGAIGSVSTDFGDLFSSGTGAYSFGPSVSWAFLDLGRVRSRIEAADAGAAGNLALYEGTVLRALEEAENALIGFSHSRVERDRLAESASASSNAARLARLRFEGGVADFLQVLDAERTLLEAEDRLAQSQTRTATGLVGVYTAVAGGWPERAPEMRAQAGKTSAHPEQEMSN